MLKDPFPSGGVKLINLDRFYFSEISKLMQSAGWVAVTVYRNKNKLFPLWLICWIWFIPGVGHIWCRLYCTPIGSMTTTKYNSYRCRTPSPFSLAHGLPLLSKGEVTSRGGVFFFFRKCPCAHPGMTPLMSTGTTDSIVWWSVPVPSQCIQEHIKESEGFYSSMYKY